MQTTITYIRKLSLLRHPFSHFCSCIFIHNHFQSFLKKQHFLFHCCVKEKTEKHKIDLKRLFPRIKFEINKIQITKIAL